MTREEAIDVLHELWITKYGETPECKVRQAIDMAIKVLEQEPKTGHWIDGWVNEYKTCPKVTCSECGIDGTLSYKEYKYCPNCGAKMVEPQERSDKE